MNKVLYVYPSNQSSKCQLVIFRVKCNLVGQNSRKWLWFGTLVDYWACEVKGSDARQKEQTKKKEKEMEAYDKSGGSGIDQEEGVEDESWWYDDEGEESKEIV